MTIRAAGTAGLTRSLLLGAAATALALPMAAHAQEGTEVGDEIEEIEVADGNRIIVTATKRETTLQETPVAVTVTGAEKLERDQIRDLKDLQTVVPSLQVGQRQSVANTNFFIRGFGNGANNAGIEPSVGVFVDGVYRSRTAAQITDLPNVSRIEVLRGPQSTLFGKNASAGVISITTQEPQFDLEAMGELTYGSYDQIIGKAYVTGPINDMVAASIAGGFNRRDGFFEDRGAGNRINDRDRWFVRGQLLVDDGDRLAVRLIADYDAIDENCCAVVNVQSGLATPAILALGGQVTDPADPFSGVVYTNYGSLNDIKNMGLSAQVDYDIGDWTLTSISAYRETDSYNDQDSDFTSADLLDGQTIDLNLATKTQEFRVTGSVGDRVDVLLGAFYITEDVRQTGALLYGPQFRNYANLLVLDQTGGALNLAALEGAFGGADQTSYAGQFFRQGTGFDERYRLDSEAISLFGQVDVEVMDGLVLTLGGNWTQDKKTFATGTVSSDVFSSINLDAPQYAPFRGQLLGQGFVSQAVGKVLGLDRGATLAEVQQFAGSSPENFAAFQAIQTQAGQFAAANANNPLANPLAPLRAFQFLPPFLNVPNAVEDGKVKDSDFSYTARLAYDLSPDVNVYVSYATGFKASSINLSRDSRPAPADRAAIEAAGLDIPNLVYRSRLADPETSRVIEAGVKSTFDNISVNLTVFDQEISGFQSNIFTGTGFALLNAGKQSTFGVEMESVANLGALTLAAAATYLDPVYDEFVISSVGDLSGTRPADIPEWTVALSAQYEIELGNGRLVPSASYLWKSEEQLIEGLPGFLVRGPDGAIIDNGPALAAAAQFTRDANYLTASLTYECDCGLDLSVWGRNLLDEQDLGVVFDSPAQPLGISGYPSDPRTYGITARYRFR